jgi:hypothetical protein
MSLSADGDSWLIGHWPESVQSSGDHGASIKKFNDPDSDVDVLVT